MMIPMILMWLLRMCGDDVARDDDDVVDDDLAVCGAIDDDGHEDVDGDDVDNDEDVDAVGVAFGHDGSDDGV